MTRSTPCGLAAALALAVLALPSPAEAARSYDNCVGFITSLPAVISTQGTWCMDRDLSTALASGNAITISTNNVTLDCNDFKLGGLAAGAGTQAYGIRATSRQNLTVRNCNVRGFQRGIHLDGIGGGGHSVEDNRLDGNTAVGIHLAGDGSSARGNRVFDTGGTPYSVFAVGVDVRGSVDLIDNLIANVTSNTSGGATSAEGIYSEGNSAGHIRDNRISGVVSTSGGAVSGILVTLIGYPWISGNHLVGSGSGNGLACPTGGARASGNHVSAFATALSSCFDAGGNILP